MHESHIRYERDDDGIVTLTMDWPGEAVNLVDRQFAPLMEDLLSRLEAEREQIAGVILTSAKSTFFAGGDLKWFAAMGPADGPQIYALAERTKAALRRLELLGRPVVAAIEGSALGGGWELALACHHRVVLDSPSIQLGLPEVTLGLLPGGGGIVRMVRLLGLKEAMPFLMEGTLMRPAEAAQHGLVALAADRAAMLAQARAFITANPAPSQPYDRKGFRLPGGSPSEAQLAQQIAVAPAMLIAKTRGCYPAPQAILSAAVEGAQVDLATAGRIESRYFAELLSGQVAKNMISAFFLQMNEIKSGASRPPTVPRWRASRVGVIGAGMMGSGIAYAAALRGLPVLLNDTSLERAERGKGHSASLSARRVERGQMGSEQREQLLARITPSAAIDDLAGCDLIIEAVFEQTELKQQVIQASEGLLAEAGVFASNTSTLPISGLASFATRPERFIGLHFFSPVDRMQLVEIVKGQHTSRETLARAYDYVQQIGKLPIVVNDGRGFFTSRVIRTFLLEAAGMLEEGYLPAAIENAALQVGFAVGPLALLDEISLSLALAIVSENRLAAEAASQPYQATPGEAVVRRMVVEYGRVGKAAGAGFYEYPAEGKKFLWPQLNSFASAQAGSEPLDVRELGERMLMIQALEAVHCLEEGVLESTRDANIGSIFGIGFPSWTGGAIQYINHVGVPSFAARVAQLATAHGPRFAPPALLLAKAEQGMGF